jgi:hypothetical protein
MQIDVHCGRRHYRLHEANSRILGIEQRTVELHGARAPAVRWTPVWKIGRPLRATLLPVIAEARHRLGGSLRPAEAQDLAIIKWMVETGRASVPPWCWPDRPPRQPKQVQQQTWRQRREPGGWPPLFASGQTGSC